MNERIPLSGADEFDAFQWRHAIKWRAGGRHAIKHRYQKRLRKVLKHRTIEALMDMEGFRKE